MGELQRRIRELLKITETEDEVLNIVSPKPFLEIVEEMTKEFPHLIPQIPMGMDRVNDYINRELNPWLKKWLMPTAQKELVAEK